MAEVSIDEIVARTKAQLDINTADHDLFFEMNINEAVRSLDSIDLFEPHQVTLDVTNLQAPLPCGFYKLLAAKLYCNQSWYNNMYYVDSNFLTECGCESTATNSSYFVNTFKIIGSTIHLLSTNTDVTQITMAYLGLKTATDNPSLWYIDELYERALWNYAAWRFCEKYEDQYSARRVERYESQWKAQKRWLRGEAQQNSFDLKKWFMMNTTFNQVRISPKVW